MLNSLAYNLQTCFLNLFLNKGMMFASYHSNGTIPSYSDMLNRCASGVLICSTICFSIFRDIPSTSGVLFSFTLLILLATTFCYITFGAITHDLSQLVAHYDRW